MITLFFVELLSPTVGKNVYTSTQNFKSLEYISSTVNFRPFHSLKSVLPRNEPSHASVE